MKIICFGDSNTYGYDPRAYFGGRYAADSRWVDILAEKGGHETVNYGQNGRSIPAYREELELYGRIFEGEKADFLIVMLGSNDILSGLNPKAACARMERLINSLPIECRRILLVAPPVLREGAWVEGGSQIEASRILADMYRQLAGNLGLHFADSGEWAVDIAHDGVHFSARGHRIFAEEIHKVIEKIKEI